jgi:hypothetical protein
MRRPLRVALRVIVFEEVKWILQLSAACLLLATALHAQKETFTPASDVSFRISTEQRSYKAGEQITLNFRITNISYKPLYVPREMGSDLSTKAPLVGLV